MVIGYRKSMGIERIDKNPTLDFIQNYIGGGMDLLEIANNISIFYSEENILKSGGTPTLVIKYSDTTYFDCLCDVLVFGDFVFTSSDELGCNKELDSRQESFILSHLCELDDLAVKRCLADGLGVLDMNEIKVLDLRG